MSVFKTNHQEASAGFEPLPIGEYEGIITQTEFKKSSTGNDMIVATITLRDLPEQHQFKGRKYFNNLVFTEKAQSMVQGFLKAVGIPDGTDFASYEDICKAIAMKPVRIKNRHQVYNGETRDGVNYCMPTKHPIGEGEQLPQASSDPVFSTGPVSPAQAQKDDLPF